MCVGCVRAQSRVPHSHAPRAAEQDPRRSVQERAKPTSADGEPRLCLAPSRTACAPAGGTDVLFKCI